MKKKYLKLLLSLVLFLPNFIHAQLDDVHYIPPFYGRTNVDQHYLIISTLSTGGVPYEVRRGDGTLVNTGTVSKLTPRTILLGTGYAAVGMLSYSELNTTTNEGLIVTALDGTPIFCNVRHSQRLQGFSLTSKGAETSPGTNFRVGFLQNADAQTNKKSHFISVMATEDNTVVNFGDFKPNVRFEGTPTSGGTSDPINITLNAGESYVIATHANVSKAGNLNDVNGSLVTSDKPIVVNCGSWLGGNASNGNRDIGTDQLVPFDYLGNQYAFVEGVGPVAIEQALVVAIADSTVIFLNGNATPFATINAGDYLFIPNSEYTTDRNMFVTSNNNFYMFQNMCGPSTANPSFNFIPPLRCSGNTEVVIPSVELIGNASIGVTARTGADVYMNGVLQTGGLQVSGNPYWVTYNTAVTPGDYNILSDSVINVTLLNNQGARGGAGYFSGFAKFLKVNQAPEVNFTICGDSTETFVIYNLEAPYYSVDIDYLTPGKGTLDTIGTSGDTLFFSYDRVLGALGVDSINVRVCKEIVCGGAIP